MEFFNPGGNLWPGRVVVTGVDPDFELVVASRYDLLLRSAYLLCGDHQVAEDLVQTTFTRLHRAWRRAGRVEDLDAYLYTVLVNVSRSWWRRKWHGERPTQVLPERPGRDAYADVEIRAALLAALGTLPARQREVLALRFLVGLSEAETARAVQCSLGTVKSRASRALATLRSGGLLEDDRDPERQR